MYKSTQQWDEELSTIQMSAENQNNLNSSKKLIERWEWEESGIWVIKTEEGYFAAIGNNKITETYEDRESVEIKLREKHWDILLLSIAVIGSKIGDEIEDRIWRKIEDKLNNERPKTNGL